MRARSWVVGSLLAVLPAGLAGQQHGHSADDLGTVDFQVSCDAVVRPAFDRALALMHHMMYEEARQAFVAIAENHRDCGMAQWGVAMTLFQPLWPSRPSADDLARGRALIERVRSMRPPSDREQALIVAAQAFFHDPDADWWTRIRGWVSVMERAYAEWPDDIEMGALYALSQLAIAGVSEDPALHRARAAEVLLEIHQRVPTHPGAVHYTIHANDAQGREGHSLDVVRSYDDIAPQVPHALHMPTHIYVRLGDWPGVIEWNRKSADAALRFPAGDAVSHHYAHAIDYLVYAHLQRGDEAAARAVIEEFAGHGPHQPTFLSAFHLAAIPARYAVERRNWAEAAGLEARSADYIAWDQFWWPEAMTWFAKGLGAVGTGDLDAARIAEARMIALRDAAAAAGEDGFRRYIETDRLVLAGWLAHYGGDSEAAVTRMREAVEMEASIQKHPVTPGAILPPYEALGSLLLLLERYDESLAAFEAGLEIWPNRYHSLLGAARAARRAGDEEAARAHYTTLLEVVGDSESDRDGVQEARAFTDM